MLIDEIEAFLQRHPMPIAKFGRGAVNDSGLVTRVRNGRSCREKTCERVRAFMQSYESGKAENANP